MAATSQNRKRSFCKQANCVQHELEFCGGERWLAVSDW